ncbi:sensor histidine kinase [Aestuariibacter sp. GS-14]|uniref:ATP-binding protein n=1 Tax=Aestuariibacter sp. GS-14 TaxID=2590670 RepID=UPI00112D4B57|nr:HAMP domain-containing sensor histidine kinase [Aestuariibacter sp. GS-14]TPV54358.1 sensor histidine kinase [Aestuariibacter sp. GS-14]
MRSIYKTLTRRLSLAISVLVISVLIIADVAVDGWIENQFNKSMLEKVGMLETLVKEDAEGVEFDFAGEFMPEFEGTGDPEYFQLWRNSEIFEKSDTLSLVSENSLLFVDLPLDTFHLEDYTLPDGRTGRIAYIRFIPQIDSDKRADFYQQQGDTPRNTMTLAYAASTEELYYALWLIDGSFILALILVPLIIRFTVKNTVTYALNPLNELNTKISRLNFGSENLSLSLDRSVEELQPIVNSINRFIIENLRLYEQQKRLTSDIAHELKTPVTELTTLSEIAMRFPGDESLEASFKPEVLSIAHRMKSIITGILTIHGYSGKQLDCSTVVNVQALLTRIIRQQNTNRIVLIAEEGVAFEITSNLFALESAFTNLLANALQHSKPETTVKCRIEKHSHNALLVHFSNIPSDDYSEKDLNQFFEPLWQKDAARTSTENFGLGLTIVSVLIKAIGGNISVRLDGNVIYFSVQLPIGE